MDKLSIISGTLFFAADVFAIVSLIIPEWIVSNVGGSTKLGLVTSCMTIHSREETCFTTNTHPEWIATFLFIFSGCICITITSILLLISYWRYRIVKYARWSGFAGMVLFCIAAVIFPVGFRIEEIGGEAYQLPNSYDVGMSYIFFVLALWITVISELFAGKVCLPHF